MQREKAQELFDYITDNGDNIENIVNRFNLKIEDVDDFIDLVTSDLKNEKLYGFIKVK